MNFWPWVATEHRLDSNCKGEYDPLLPIEHTGKDLAHLFLKLQSRMGGIRSIKADSNGAAEFSMSEIF